MKEVKKKVKGLVGVRKKKGDAFLGPIFDTSNAAKKRGPSARES